MSVDCSEDDLSHVYSVFVCVVMKALWWVTTSVDCSEDGLSHIYGVFVCAVMRALWWVTRPSHRQITTPGTLCMMPNASSARSLTRRRSRKLRSSTPSRLE